jgi:deoxyribodipyrimidine photo-lyase
MQAMTTASNRPAILWFRNDLRLADHAALHAAIETGRPVLPVFVLDDAAPGPWRLGGASRWWLHHSLEALGKALTGLGAPLVLRRGDSVAVLSDLVSETGAADVFTGGLAEPRARRVDQAVAEALGDRGARLQRMRTTTLFNPDSIRTKAGGAYGVYTPFANACLALGGPKPPLPAPKALHAAAPVRSDRLRPCLTVAEV